MPLSFLVPAFLAGLAALAIPVLVHLTRRQTKTPVSFPSLMFVRRVPHSTVAPRRIHRWPLLLLRCAAIVLLVLAFSRPLLGRAGALLLPDASGGREVVLLLDRSYSMDYGDRWTRAVSAANAVIDSLAARDRATLLLFDSRAEAAIRSTGDRTRLRAALRDAHPGPGATRYAPALRYAQRVLTSSVLSRGEVVLISDFQQTAWQAAAAEMSSIRLPSGAVVRPVNVADTAWSNATVASVALQRTRAAGRDRVAVTARLTAHGAPPNAQWPVTFEMNGRAVQTRTATLGPSGTATVEFDEITLPAGTDSRGVVSIPEDSIPVDDRFSFVLSPNQDVEVLVVDGDNAPGTASFYLDRALGLGDVPSFTTTVERARDLKAADLTDHAVVVLDQAPFPSGVLGDRLRSFVQGGGGLVMILGDNQPGEWGGVLPVGGIVNRAGSGGTTLGYVDLGHPVFAPFSAPRSGDFTTARVFRYRSIASTPTQRTLARFGDGAAALTEQPVGAGRVLIWASTLDDRWNDLALQPVYLPFVHQLVKYAAGYTPARAWLTVGEPFDPTAARGDSSELSLVLTPAGERETIEPGTPLMLDEPGFYELRDRRSGDVGAILAVNVDASESDLDTFDPRMLVSAVAPTSPVATASTAPDAALTVEQRERRQSAWRYLVILAFILLTAETVLSNRSRRAGPTGA